MSDTDSARFHCEHNPKTYCNFCVQALMFKLHNLGKQNDSLVAEIQRERAKFAPCESFEEYKKAWEELDDERKATIEKMKQALTGRTVSCESCNQMAREIEGLKEEIKDRADTENVLTRDLVARGEENGRLREALGKMQCSCCAGYQPHDEDFNGCSKNIAEAALQAGKENDHGA